MRLIVGILVVVLSVFGGYAASGAHMAVLFQPFEFIIILGAAAGSFVIAKSAESAERHRRRVRHAVPRAAL